MKMESRTERNSNAFAQKKIKRVLATLMAILLVVTAIDLSGIQYVSAAGESKVDIIKAFTALPAGTANQQLAVGVSGSAINLPNSLTVTSEVYYVDAAQAATGAAISSNPVYNLTPVTWKIDAGQSSSASFDSSVGNNYYTYVPVLPALDSECISVRLADGVSLPQIRVEIIGTDEASVTESNGTPHYYATVEAAIAAAQGMSGSTVKLLKNVTPVSGVIVTSGTFSIDLNGQTMNFTATKDITIGGSAKVTFKDSGIGGKITSTSYYAVYIDTGATVRFEGGTYEGGTTASIENTTGNVGDLLAEGYLYRSNGSGSWVSDLSVNEISNVTVQTVPADLFSICVTEANGTPHYYLDLNKAITAAMGMPGSTVMLLKDVTSLYSVQINSGTVTIDLHGQTLNVATSQVFIYGTANVTFKDSGSGGKIISTGMWATVSIDSGVTVRFEGGTYQSGSAASIETFSGNVGDLLAEGYLYRSNSSGSWVSDLSVNEISNVTVQASPVKITAQPEDAVELTSYSVAPTLSVTAETGAYESGKDINYKWYKGDGTLIEGETGASYTVPPELPEGTYTYYCTVTCDGYTVNTRNASFFVTSGTGNYIVTTSEGNTFNYQTLEAAFALAKSKPDSTVKLLADATTASRVDISSGTFTIDLNGNTWTSNASTGLYISNGSHITLKDSSATDGKFTSSTATQTIYVKSAVLTIESGIYENESGSSIGSIISAGFSGTVIGTVNVHGGTFQTSKSLNALAYFQRTNVVISGGTFNNKTVMFDNCPSVALSGGTYYQVQVSNVNVSSLLASGYGFKNVSGGTWVNNLGTTGYANDLSHYYLGYPSTVQPVPVQITAQPQGASATYGYTSSEAPSLSVTAKTTAAAPDGSNISYQWYRVKSTTETSDTAVGTNSSTLTIPTGLALGTYSYYCVVSCDGYIVNTQNAVLTVAKADLSGANVTLAIPAGGYTYDTTTKTPAVTVTLGSNTLTLASDYIVDYTNNTEAGTATVTITGIDNYFGTADKTFAIVKADQNALSITQVTGKMYGDADFLLKATGGSGSGEVTYSVPDGNGVLSISGSNATIIGAGTVTVTATKAEDKYYHSISTTLDITIDKAPAPSIIFPAASDLTYGQKLSESILTGGSTLYGTFAWTDSNTAPTVANSGYEMIFTPNANTIKNYEAITDTTNTVAITVSKATPAVTVNTDCSDDAGSRKAILTVEVTGAGAGEAPTGTVKFINSTSGSDENIAGATAIALNDGKATYTWTGLAKQIYKVKAVYSGSGNYNAATSTELSFDSAKQNQAALSIGNIATKTYGDGTFSLITMGGSGVGAVNFTSSDPTIVSISGTTATIHKAGDVILTATKAATDTYNEATASVALTVGKKTLTVKADDKLNIINSATMPALTYIVTGLVGSDTFTEPTLSTTATDTNTVGEYDITISGGTLANSDNYAINYTSGKLTIINEPASPGGSSSSGGSSNGGGSSTATPQPDTGTPVIKDASNKAGWEAIKEQISQTREGDTVTIEMNGSLVVPGEVLDAIRGTDTTLVFDMGDGITWSINGQSITAGSLNDVNLDVTMNTDAIPAGIISQMAGEQASSTISLAYDGPFGFTSVLTINLNKINAEKYGNLFYYNPVTKQLTLQAVEKIGEKGNVELPFPHASDYVVIISQEPMLEKTLGQIAISTVQGTLYVGGTEKKSMTLKLELPQLLKEAVEKDSSILKITYQSSNPKVAIVTASGTIIAKNAGQTTVTTLVTINGVQRKFQTVITVGKAYIKLIRSTNTLKTGSTFTYKAIGYGVKTEDIMYYTSKKSVIEINKTTGMAKARTKGTGYIIAKAGNVKVKIKVKVS